MVFLLENLFPDVQQLPDIFRGYPDIQAVYLFGSAATGQLHRESDLDLGVVPATGTIRGQQLDVLADLARHGFCRVDLVFLDTNDIVLKFEVVRHNRLVYSTDDFDHGSFFSLVLRQYFDFLPYLGHKPLSRTLERL